MMNNNKTYVCVEEVLGIIDRNKAYMSDVGYIHAKNAVREATVIDAVEVVRCKDCKYREKSPWDDGYRCGNPYDGMASAVDLKDNDFCSYGEKRG